MSEWWQEHSASCHGHPPPRTREGLYNAMSEVSEEMWCAGWLIDLDHILWAALHDTPVYWISAKEIAEIRALDEWQTLVEIHDEVGGWCTFDGWVTDEEWAEIREQRGIKS